MRSTDTGLEESWSKKSLEYIFFPRRNMIEEIPMVKYIKK